MPESALSARRLADRERQIDALTLRKAGLTFQQIAAQLRYASKGSARNAIVGLLRKTTTTAVEELRKTEGDRLDRLQLAVWQQAIGGDLRAIDRVLRIMKRRADLFGLDMPPTTKAQRTGQDGKASAFRLVWDDGTGEQPGER